MAACCCSCLVRNPFPWLAALGSFLALSQSARFGGLTILLTSSALILCPVIICRLKPCKQKSMSRQDSPRPSSTAEVMSDSSLQEVADEPIQSENQHETRAEEDDAVKFNGESEFTKKQKEDKTGGEYLVRSPEVLLSDSDSLDHSTSSDDYSENDSMFRENLSYSTNYSDGSISDEESLIEIALPTGHFVDSKKSQEPSWYGYPQKWPDCSLQSHFRQQNWMEMLNEMSEENFIEIDLCMGSIKCSRFEIKA